MYENQMLYQTPICRAENIRFKAEIVKMPSSVVDWRKIEMNNLKVCQPVTRYQSTYQYG